MEKIVKKDGYVYFVQDYDRKGFETYVNMGKDPDDPRWNEETASLDAEATNVDAPTKKAKKKKGND